MLQIVEGLSRHGTIPPLNPPSSPLPSFFFWTVPTEVNKKKYRKYQRLAEEASQKQGVQFVGRLANYKYINMDEAIDLALGAIASERGCAHMCARANACV